MSSSRFRQWKKRYFWYHQRPGWGGQSVVLGSPIFRFIKLVMAIKIATFVLIAFFDEAAGLAEYLVLSSEMALGKLQLWRPLTALWINLFPRALVFDLATVWLLGSPLSRRWSERRFAFFFLSTGMLGLTGAMFLGMLAPREVCSGSMGSSFAILLASAIVFRDSEARLFGSVRAPMPMLVFFLSFIGTLTAIFSARWLDLAAGTGGVLSAFYLLRQRRFGHNRKSVSSQGKPRAVEATDYENQRWN